MTSLLVVVVTILFCGVLSVASIENEKIESDHSHVAWNFFVPGRKGVQVSAVLYNEDVNNSEKQTTELRQHQQCQMHQADHNDYAWNYVLSAIKEIELKSLSDNKTIAKIDINNEADIENLVAKGNTINGLELRTLPPYVEVSDDYHEPSVPKCQECEKSEPVQGLHWRDWTGLIPPDAIVGDYNVVNDTKVPVYLAQGLLQVKDAGVIPTYLFNDSKHAKLPFEGVHNVTKNVKVLCGDQEDVTWISWKKAAHLNKERDYVNAGFERTFPLYFGRCRHKEQYVFGKVVLRDLATYFAYEDSEYYITSFDVLCYRKALSIDQFVKD